MKWIIMPLLLLLISNSIYEWSFFSFLSLMAIQDYKTYYFSKYWLVGLIFVWFGQRDMLSSLVFGLPCWIMYVKRSEWIGSVDCIMISCLAFILGLERMIVCMCMALFLGFIYHFIYRDRLIPFVSCLAVGAIVAYLKGYMLFYAWIQF